jgi:hypothetical protein
VYPSIARHQRTTASVTHLFSGFSGGVPVLVARPRRRIAGKGAFPEGREGGGGHYQGIPPSTYVDNACSVSGFCASTSKAHAEPSVFCCVRPIASVPVSRTISGVA